MCTVCVSDHEGGNVSAHTIHLVGSALSDPYLSYAAGMCGLAGPLHGLANQEVLVFYKRVIKELGENPTNSQVAEYVQKLMQGGMLYEYSYSCSCPMKSFVRIFPFL